MNLNLLTTKSNAFSERTKINAKSSSLTIYLYDQSFEHTSGRALTQKYSNSFLPICYQHGIKNAVASILNFLNNIPDTVLLEKEFSINVAGNAISRFGNEFLWQPKINAFLYILLFHTKKHFIAKGAKLLVRSGGQTGADWGGIVAAKALDIDCNALFPSGWRQRSSSNNDIYFTKEEISAKLDSDTRQLLQELDEKRSLLAKKQKNKAIH